MIYLIFRTDESDAVMNATAEYSAPNIALCPRQPFRATTSLRIGNSLLWRIIPCSAKKIPCSAQSGELPTAHWNCSANERQNPAESAEWV